MNVQQKHMKKLLKILERNFSPFSLKKKKKNFRDYWKENYLELFYKQTIVKMGKYGSYKWFIKILWKKSLKTDYKLMCIVWLKTMKSELLYLIIYIA